MRTLTKNETTVLTGDYNQLELPDKVELYIVTGVPQIFKRVGANKFNDDDNWLYLPIEDIKCIRQKLIRSVSCSLINCISETSIEDDEKYIYPIMIDGMVDAVLVSDSSDMKKINPVQEKLIIDTIQTDLTRKNKISEEQCFNEFIELINHPDTSFDEFQQKFLKLLIQDLNESCAGLYYKDRNTYKLRMIVGDISNFDHFYGVIDSAFAAKIDKQLSLSNNYITAGAFDASIRFSAEPHNIYYAHKSVKSFRDNFIILLPIKDNLSLEIVHRLSYLSQLASIIHVNTFVSEAAFVEIYQNMFGANGKIRSFDEILKVLFNKMLSILPIDRISFALDYQGTFIAEHGKLGQIDVTRKDNIIWDDQVYAGEFKEVNHLKIRHASPFGELLPGLSDHFKQVKNNLLFKVDISEHCRAVASFSTRVDFETLNKYQKIFCSAVNLIKFYFSLEKYSKSNFNNVVGEQLEPNQSQEIRRWQTLSKLTGGYFNSLYSFVSVMMGQADIIEESLSKGSAYQNRQSVQDSLRKIHVASEDLIFSLNIFSRICPDSTRSGNETIPCKSFIKTLPEILNEYLAHLETKKKLRISVHVDTAPATDFSLVYNDIFDIVMPLIVKLLDFSVSNGIIRISANNNGGYDNLLIKYPNHMLGDLALDLILDELFVDHAVEIGAPLQGKIKFGMTTLYFDASHETVTIKFQKKSPVSILNDNIIFQKETLGAK